jgi:hypothetical protein
MIGVFWALALTYFIHNSGRKWPWEKGKKPRIKTRIENKIQEVKSETVSNNLMLYAVRKLEELKNEF